MLERFLFPVYVKPLWSYRVTKGLKPLKGIMFP
jgi:hypothetical protein